MGQKFLPLPPLTGKRYAPVKVLAIIPASSLIGMPGGDGTFFMSSGS